MATARIEVELVGAEQAQRRLGQITEAQKRLKAEFAAGKISAEQYARSTTRLSQAKTLLSGQVNTTSRAMAGATAQTMRLTNAQQEAATKAVLLGQQLGVTMPTAIQRLVVRTQAATTAVNALFAVGTITFFASAIATQVIPRISSLVERFRQAKEQVDSIRIAIESTVGLLSRLPEPVDLTRQISTVEQIIKRLQIGLEETRGELMAFGAAARDTEALRRQAVAFEKQIELAEKIRDRLKELRAERDPLGTLRESLISVDPELAALISSLMKVREETGAAARGTEELAKVFVAQLQPAIRPIPSLLTEVEKRLRDIGTVITTFTRQMPDLLRITQQLGEAKLPPSPQQLADQARLLDEWARQAREQFERVASTIEQFLDRVFITTRSWKDAMNQLWMQLARGFIAQVSRMVAAWLMGMRQIQTGGVLSTLLGGLFGFGGTAQAATTGATAVTSTGAPIIQNGQIVSTLTPVISAGQGVVAGPGGQLPAAARGGAGLGLAALGGAPGLLAAAAFLGIPLLAGGIRSGGLLTLGGFLGGGLAGFALGGVGALAGTALGAFLGPIGAVVGALIGHFFGRRGKLKRQASRVADEGFAEMQRIIKEFERFQIDFESAIGSVTAVWGQMVQSWGGMGSVGRRSIADQQKWFDQVIKRINDLQRERELRLGMISGLPVPEFQFGGLVKAIHGHSGRILAILEQGEGVVSRRGMQQLGEQGLERLNRGRGAAGTTPVTINVSFPNALVVDRQAVTRLVNLLGPDMERRLRRLAQDQGLSKPF